MSRRVVLVDLFWTRDKDPRVPLGHASLFAALRANTTVDVRSVVLAVNSEGVDAEAVVARVLAEADGALPHEVDVAIGAYVWGEDLLQAALPELRRRGFAGRIILGGPQISYATGGLERLYPHADVFVRGYGEAALCALAASGGRPRLPGIHYARGLDSCTQAAVDLDTLPSPWLGAVIPVPPGGFLRWETQRGCPFRCSFCQHREPGARLARRELNLARVVREADLFCDAGVADIAVLDPIFNAAPHATALLEHFVERRFAGRISLQCRAESIDAAFLDAAGALRTRLEFGLQTIHPREGKAVLRGNDLARVEATLAAVRARGIDHEVSIIFGLPEQTLTSFLETVEWCLDRQIPVIRAFPLMLLRGTELERRRTTWGLVDDGRTMAKVIASSTFGPAEHREMARVAEALDATEGAHPRRLADLLRLAATLEPAEERWQPIVAPRAEAATTAREARS